MSVCYMNIIKIRTNERKMKINSIAESIKAAENPDYKKLLMMCCTEFGLSMRTAKEYIKIAKWQVNTNGPV